MRQRDDFDPAAWAQLHRTALELARSLAPPRHPGSGFIGGDPTGAVRIALDGVGNVLEVTIRESLHSELRPERLGQAVCQAMSAATTARSIAWAQREGENGSVHTTSATADPGWEPGDPSAPESVAGLREVLSLLERVDQQIAAFGEALERQATEHVIGHNPTRTVRVTLAGGCAVRVQFHQRWLSTRRAGAIGTGIREALNSALAQAQAAAVHADPTGVIGELNSLGRDPEALFRKVGLIR